ncbi:Muscarinic acetylcholine receptor gar-3 [Parelaphostrongylus tenuis]|uniref:Muscarinic acetylcholine receptor gar-3 n=1 Tax=Parelaphostrongylus tenuis TaxID=148309 RepID=A0AAD5RD27_PARTN|nr:Muscarinic acetylcholine receptor gar-3 [Parelaphostrongylus tenuis]
MISGKMQMENSTLSGSVQLRNDLPTFDTYTVLIELSDEGIRPSVRLSRSCSSQQETGSRHGFRSNSNPQQTPKLSPHGSSKGGASPMKNGRLSKTSHSDSANDRKSDKEKKKNDRKQESKAAKTLSAILAAFIVTWTPYNVIVCYEAFFPNSVPNYIFTASYFLCYINSTINPLCYALCNARFRHTYRRILKCKFGAERPNVFTSAYVRRQ